MKNNELNKSYLDTAIKHLNNVEIEDVESVEIKGQRYVDDSEALIVEVVFENYEDVDKTVTKSAMQIMQKKTNWGLFKAKPKMTEEMKESEWLPEKLDPQGYVYGYLVENYIVGNFVEVADEYLHLAYWCPIMPETVIYLGEEE